MAAVVSANRAWEAVGKPGLDLSEYRHRIAPSLKDHPLKNLMAATGLSKGACSKSRMGSVVPHPRHWQVLQKLLS
jgi:hypothetical protein